MRIGWNAAGLLQPVWTRYPGGRDALAAAAGTQPTVLSSINSGKRRLGADLAKRIADAAKVDIAVLGAPSQTANSSTVLTGWRELAQLVVAADEPLSREAQEILEAAAAELEASAHASLQFAAVLRDRLARETTG